MRRRVSAILSALSLILCIAMVGMWVRSYFVTDYLWNHPEKAGAGITQGVGVICFWYELPIGRFHPVIRTQDWPHHFHDIGYGLGPKGDRYDDRVHSFFVPNWLLTCILLLLPLASVARFQRTRRRPGTCSNCGYDLRATPNRCQECGAVPATGVEVR
jgi:hypothetical protein